MGSRGPAPKENAIRRNEHEHAVELSPEAQPGRPLPKSLPVKSSAAKHFWKTWAESPQSATWMETDWEELAITTLLVEEFYKGDTKLAGEIRQRVAKWGATNEDRARLRMKFEKTEEESVEPSEKELTAFDMDQQLYDKLRAV
ncbi:hypothetical protein ASD97_26025 [Streptomyces sp. Root63]|nr:hypothetical protein ASD29_32330 [Streptomyces sp. Root1295]KRA34095.1 hypothetical protein ASD97_26025 [Streptomyces sp. Root63]